MPNLAEQKKTTKSITKQQHSESAVHHKEQVTKMQTDLELNIYRLLGEELVVDGQSQIYMNLEIDYFRPQLYLDC